jgi:DNA-binding PadR family transcriptional regulator
MHIRALSQLADGRQLTARTLVQIDPGLEHGVVALLNQLLSQGLIDSRSPVTPGGAMTPEPIYFITDLGRKFLYRLPEDPG